MADHDIEKAQGPPENGSQSSETRHDQDYGTRGDDGGDDEYGNLLDFVQTSADSRRSGRGGGEDNGNVTKRHRTWYAPWKTYSVTYDKNGEKVSDETFKTPGEWLNTDMRQGLAESDIAPRRSKTGWNELEAKRENLFIKFFTFFMGPILYTMELAVILAGGLRDWIDFGVIIGILMLNAFVGWYQEKAAGDIVEKLKAGIALKSTVIRGGQEHLIEARELVPGDVVVIEDGNTVPGDGRVLADYSDRDGSKAAKIIDRIRAGKDHKGAEGGDGEEKGQDDEDGIDKGPSVLSIDQAAITGESLAVDKYHDDTVYYTTGCKRGKALVLITATGKTTFVGRTASLVTGAKGKGHFQIVMTSIGTTLLVFVAAFTFAFWIGGFFRGVGIAEPKDNNLLVYTLIFLIIGVPVGLPCVTTTTLAVGAAYLAKRQAIVQKLSAIEALAGVDVLCSDKTGTLTANKLRISNPYVVEGEDVNWMMAVAALASSHALKSLDPIDKVTIETLAEYPKAQEMLRHGWKTKKFTPFDPVSKRITAEVERDGKPFVAAKGAPNAILKLCATTGQAATEYRQKTYEFAKRGFRSLGVAVHEDGKWRLLGLLSLSDPPRDDTASTINEARGLGISVKMLTGDAVAIAIEVCKQLGMGSKVYDSQKLIAGGMSGSDIHDFVEAADGFGEVFPEHKYQVVEMLQQRGHLTAMTGDGVNDAPSLSRADCGIAVEGASDAARAAADVVFLDEGLSTIITSIKVSRQIFHRMKAYIQYRIALCLHLEIYLLLSILILNEVIRVDLIVFIAIFADVATIAIAYDNAPHAARPVEWQLPKIWIISVILGIGLAAGTWILRGTMFLRNGGVIQNFGDVQSILFLEVSLTENWLIFITRGAGTLPSWQLVGAILGVDALATVFTLFGWLNGADPSINGAGHHGGWTDIVTVVRVYGFSLGVTVVLALIYFLLQSWPWLDNLGRQIRSHKNQRIEDLMGALQRVTIVHSHPNQGEEGIGGRYTIVDKASEVTEEAT